MNILALRNRLLSLSDCRYGLNPASFEFTRNILVIKILGQCLAEIPPSLISPLDTNFVEELELNVKERLGNEQLKLMRNLRLEPKIQTAIYPNTIRPKITRNVREGI